MSTIVQQDAIIYSLLYFCKLLYMFWVVTPPIIRSTYNCNYNIWHWSNHLSYLPLSWRSWNCKITEIYKLYIVASCWTIIDMYATKQGFRCSHNSPVALSIVLVYCAELLCIVLIFRGCVSSEE
jgi:hypothetical protein